MPLTVAAFGRAFANVHAGTGPGTCRAQADTKQALDEQFVQALLDIGIVGIVPKVLHFAGVRLQVVKFVAVVAVHGQFISPVGDHGPGTVVVGLEGRALVGSGNGFLLGGNLDASLNESAGTSPDMTGFDIPPPRLAHHACGTIQPEKIEQRWRKVHLFGQAVKDAGLRHAAWQTHDARNARERFMKNGNLVKDAIIAQQFAVVAEEKNHRIFQLACAFQVIDEFAHLIVHIPALAHVGGDGLAGFFFGAVDGGGIDAPVFQFLRLCFILPGPAGGQLDIVGIKERGVRFGTGKGGMGILPVYPAEKRLVVGTAIDKIDGLVGQLGGDVVFMIVGKGKGAERFMIIGMAVIIAQANLVQLIPGQGQLVGEEEMVLAKHARAVSFAAQCADQVGHVVVDAGGVVASAMFAEAHGRGKADPTGTAQRRGTVEFVKAHPLASQAIDVFRADGGVSIGRDIIGAILVRRQDQKIRLVFFGRHLVAFD